MTTCNGPSLYANWNKALVKRYFKDISEHFVTDWLLSDTKELSLILLGVTMALGLSKKKPTCFRDA